MSNENNNPQTDISTTTITSRTVLTKVPHSYYTTPLTIAARVISDDDYTTRQQYNDQ